MKQQVSAEVNSWWSTSDPETLSKIKATLKGWGMSPTEVDAALKLGSKSTEDGSMQDVLLDRQVSSIFKNGLVGIVDEDVIEKINKINEGRSDEEKFQVPVLNDKYVYSVQTVEPVKKTIYYKKIEASTFLYEKINDIAGDPKLTPAEVVAELNKIDTKRTFVTGTDYVTRVLKAEKKEGIAGALVVHTLKIAYQDASGSKEFYVALDSTDVKKLQEQLSQSLIEAKVIQAMLNKADVVYLDPNSSSK